MNQVSQVVAAVMLGHAFVQADADAPGWSDPLWVDVARECSRVMPWHPGYAGARALREAIEAGRLQALPGEAP